MTDTEKATLECRIDELCAENEQLRQENQSVGMAAYELGRASLADENAKLRGLVRVFYHCTTSGECDECPINSGGTVHLMPDTICDTIHDRMCELGIEVTA